MAGAQSRMGGRRRSYFQKANTITTATTSLTSRSMRTVYAPLWFDDPIYCLGFLTRAGFFQHGGTAGRHCCGWVTQMAQSSGPPRGAGCP